MALHRWLSIALFASLITACAGLGGQRDSLRVTVSDIEVIEATLLEQLYRVTLRVQNRSDREIAIRGGSFDLALNGRDFGSGVTDRSLRVPAWSDAQIDVRMVSTVFGWVRLVQGLQSREGEPLQYTIDGRFAVEGGFGGIGFRESGEVALPRTEPAETPPAAGQGT